MPLGPWSKGRPGLILVAGEEGAYTDIPLTAGLIPMHVIYNSYLRHKAFQPGFIYDF